MKTQITLVELSNQIADAIEADGPYSHNLIGLCLSQAFKKYGESGVLALFEEHKLEVFGFVPPKVSGQ